MNAVEFYSRVLESFGLRYAADENVLYATSTSKKKVNLDKKVLILPTEQALKEFNDHPDEVIIYHPSHENVMRRDSKTLDFTHKAIQVSLMLDYINIVQHLILLASDKDKHATLNTAQRDIIAQLPDADETLAKHMENIFDKVSPSKKPKAIDITIQRGDSKSGASRIAKVKWPILAEVLSDADTIFGVKIRKKDRNTIKTIHELLFKNKPARLTEVTSSMQQVISNETVAPSYRVLLEIYHDVKFMLLELYAPFIDIFPPLTSMDLSWEPYLGEIKKYRTLIPSFPGNEGEDPVGMAKAELPTDYTSSEATTSRPTTTTPTPTRAATPARAPVRVDTTAQDGPLTPDMFNSLTEYYRAVSLRNSQQSNVAYNRGVATPRYTRTGVERGPDIDYTIVGGQPVNPVPQTVPAVPGRGPFASGRGSVRGGYAQPQRARGPFTRR